MPGENWSFWTAGIIMKLHHNAQKNPEVYSYK